MAEAGRAPGKFGFSVCTPNPWHTKQLARQDWKP